MLYLSEIRTAFEKATYADIEPVTGSTQQSQIKNIPSTRCRLFIAELKTIMSQ